VSSSGALPGWWKGREAVVLVVEEVLARERRCGGGQETDAVERGPCALC